MKISAKFQQYKTQQHVATVVGNNSSTIVQIENGGSGTILTFIQMLRALDQLQLFQHVEIKQQQTSSLQLAKLEKRRIEEKELKKNIKFQNP